MVKLETVRNEERSEIFYFHTMEDCNKFLYTFRDHWCNVPWKEPIEVPDDYPISARDQEVMDEDPKERAERDLSWGFSLVKRLEIRQTEKQNAFVEEMISRIGS